MTDAGEAAARHLHGLQALPAAVLGAADGGRAPPQPLTLAPTLAPNPNRNPTPSQVAEYLASDAKRAGGAGFGPFQAQAFALRQDCSDVVNTLAQPVPFPYFHVVTFMLSINLVLVAYALVFFETYLSVPCFFVTCLVMQGLKEVRCHSE